jgi:hypothetical protein
LSDGNALPIGQTRSVTLIDSQRVHYAAPPEKPAEPKSFGGTIRFTVPEGGTYRIALGSAAWLDVVQSGKTVASVNHAHGPNCTGIRKLVDFPLTPGDVVLQIANSAKPEMTVLVARLQ